MTRRRARGRSRSVGTTTARGYGWQHQKQRAAIRALVDAGEAVCPRCLKPILPGQLWDLGHVDGTNKQLWSGAEHRACNRATASHRANGNSHGSELAKSWYHDPKGPPMRWGHPAWDDDPQVGTLFFGRAGDGTVGRYEGDGNWTDFTLDEARELGIL